MNWNEPYQIHAKKEKVYRFGKKISSQKVSVDVQMEVMV